MRNGAEKFWFAFCRNAEGEGGAAASSGVGPAGGGEGSGVAGAVEPSPAPTFLTQGLQTSEGEKQPENDSLKDENAAQAENATTQVEPPAAFDPAKLTLPEGVTLPEEASKAFAALLSDEKLTPQERGQQLIDLHTKTIQETAAAVTEQLTKANMDTWTKLNDEWRGKIAQLPEFKADPDGEAGKLIQACIAVGAGKDFFEALDLTGAGNHPAIVQVLHKLTRPFIEGGAVGGGAKPASQRRLGDNMYTTTNKG